MFKCATLPRYQLLCEELRGLISSGKFKPGDRLPSETELCAEYGVSRGTVVKAIEQLVSEGVVHRRQGSGSFVARPSLHRRAGNLLSFTSSASSEGHRSTQQLLSIGRASRHQAREFQCDEPALLLRRVRLLDGVPCAVHRSIVPIDVARRIDALNGNDSAALKAPGFSLYRALELAGFGVREANERVATRLATREERLVLNIAKPAAVMVVFRSSYDAFGRLVEAVEAVYHGEFYTYDMRLVSAPGPPSAGENNSLSLGGRLGHPKTGRK